MNLDAFTVQLIEQDQNAFQGLDEGSGIEQLRADMAVDAGDLNVRQGSGAAVERQRIVVGDAELGFLEAGRDIGVRLRVDVRIDAQADRRFLAALARHFVEAFEFGGGFDVEAEDAGIQRLFHFRRRLADAGEDDFLRIGTGGQDALQLTAGHNVETCAEAGEDIENGEIGIGFDGVADQRILARWVSVEDVLEFVQGRFQRGARIDIGRRAELCGNAGQGKAFGVQDAVLQGK